MIVANAIEAPGPALLEPEKALAETSLAVQMPRGPTLSFVTPPEAATLAPASPGGAPGASFGETSLTPEMPRLAILPFTPDEPPRARAHLDMPVPTVAPREALTGTSLALELPRPGALPFTEARATTPWPFMSLTEHAALCAELAFAPARAAEVLESHGLTAESKAALDHHYRDAVGASTEIRLAWNRAYAGAYEELMRRLRPERRM
jgi:hypothetical protein